MTPDQISLEDIPDTDERDPAKLIPHAIDYVLDVAGTWLAWDGRPYFVDGNAWTPHKALRRVTDHLIDHLAEVEALLAEATGRPDEWHGRTLTLDSDWARFTEPDLEEAASRLLRLGDLYRTRVGALSGEELDRERVNAWTVRQIVFHVSGVVYYADCLGRLEGR
jgi:hypothetical protein